MWYLNGGNERLKFSDKQYCDEILGEYSRESNSAILAKTIKNYGTLSEEEKNKEILNHFSFIKRAEKLTDEELVDKIKNEELLLRKYMYLQKSPSWNDKTIELFVRYDIVKKLGADWTMEQVLDVFKSDEKFVKDRISVYIGTTEDGKTNEKRQKDILKKLCEADKIEELKADGTRKITPSNAIVNFYFEYIQSDNKDYDCACFFNDKSIKIYESEVKELQKLKRKYVNAKGDGRRLMRMICLLLAWQKAYQNRFYNHRFKGYAVAMLNELIKYNPIVENGRTDSVAMIRDMEKLDADGNIELILPEVPEPRNTDKYMPSYYYKLPFCVDESKAENEKVVLEITDFHCLWEQIFVAAFGKFEILEQTDKNSKKKEYVTYKAVKRCETCGDVFYVKRNAKNCDKCNRR
jgi:hypothetical protein